MSVAKTTREPIDLSDILTTYVNCWVALSADERRVVAHGKPTQKEKVIRSSCGHPKNTVPTSSEVSVGRSSSYSTSDSLSHANLVEELTV